MEKDFDETVSELIKDYCEPSEKPDEQILIENEDLILEHFQAGNLKSFKNSKYRYKIEQAYFTYPEVNDDEQAKKYLKIYRLWLLLRINQQKENFSNPHFDKVELAYHLSSYRRELSNTEWEIDNFDERLDWLHRIKCSAGGRKWHELKNSQYDEACKLAQEIWAKGDTCIRHEMATYLKNKFPKLSHKTLQKRLTPIAEKYGKNYDPKSSNS